MDDANNVPAEHPLAIRFTGSGSEYFRIWVVNLLLILVTVGIYYPWAKVRKLRWFFANTEVGGEPLAFHGNPRSMLRGYILVAVLVGAYSAAGKLSPVAGLGAFLIIAAIWPALLHSSLRFRLANTSWRGMRMRFDGTVRGAYSALLPVIVPAALFLALQVAAGTSEQPPGWAVFAALGVVLIGLAMLPWWWWRLKRYQHDHYAYGNEHSRLSMTTRSVYGVTAETIGITLAGLIAVGIIGAVLAIVLGGGLTALTGQAPQAKAMLPLLFVLQFLLGVLAVQLIPRPYASARLQNLLWSNTASESIRFHSRLRFFPLFGLTLKNWTLIGLTLGLYWPFAAVATARLRLQAVELRLGVDPQSLGGGMAADGGAAAGEAADDLLGMDIGL